MLDIISKNNKYMIKYDIKNNMNILKIQKYIKIIWIKNTYQNIYNILNTKWHKKIYKYYIYSQITMSNYKRHSMAIDLKHWNCPKISTHSMAIKIFNLCFINKNKLSLNYIKIILKNNILKIY